MLLTSLYISLHVMSAVIWVGGMFFAYVCLRPVAASQLEPPPRLRLWVGVFSSFFPIVWTALLLLLVTGYAMIFSIWQSLAATPIYVHIMNGLGTLMLLIFMHVYFASFNRLKKTVLAEQWPAGGVALAQIRQLIALNLSLGLLVVAVASGGRYFV